jgi:hypothetical protein
MADSVSTFCVLFRHAILLSGGPAYYEKREVIERASELFGIDPVSFMKLLDLREQKPKGPGMAPESLFRDYLKQILVVVDAVDRMER